MSQSLFGQPSGPTADGLPACGLRCEAQLEKLRTRLEGDEKELVRLDGEARHLLRSLSALTKAVWAAALSTFGVLLSFLFWYVQQLG